MSGWLLAVVIVGAFIWGAVFGICATIHWMLQKR